MSACEQVQRVGFAPPEFLFGIQRERRSGLAVKAWFKSLFSRISCAAIQLTGLPPQTATSNCNAFAGVSFRWVIVISNGQQAHSVCYRQFNIDVWLWRKEDKCYTLHVGSRPNRFHEFIRRPAWQAFTHMVQHTWVSSQIAHCRNPTFCIRLLWQFWDFLVPGMAAYVDPCVNPGGTSGKPHASQAFEPMAQWLFVRVFMVAT